MTLSQPQLSAADDIRVEEVIRRGLLVDPRVGDAQEVAISTQNRFVTLRAHDQQFSSGVAVHAWRGEVTLTGTAPSLQDHDRALATVWSVPGVAFVLDELSIDDLQNSD